MFILIISKLHQTTAFIIKRQTVPSFLLIEALLIAYIVNILNVFEYSLWPNFIATGLKTQKTHFQPD